MKKLVYSLLAASLLLTGCLETTQEVTINNDGSGQFSTSSDMSNMLTMAKQMGGGDQMKEVENMVKDTTMSLAQGADSIPNLTPEEKEIVRTGNLHVNMNFPESRFITTMQFPFKSADQLPGIVKVSGKAMAETMKESMGGGSPMGGDMPEASSIDDYYNTSYSDGEIKRTLNKEKFAGAESDEYLQGMKQAAGMGLVMKATYVFNLPRPVKESEGKALTVSADKMKVTITGTIEDFFASPELLEFRIKY